MYLIIFVGFCVLITVNTESVNWRDTGSLYKVEDVRVSSCNRKSCTVQKGAEIVVEIDFIPSSPAKNLKYKITGSKFGFTIPLLDGSLCDDSDPNGQFVTGACPLKEGERITYKYVDEVPEFVPSISGTVNVKVFDENKVLIKGTVDVQVNTKNSASPFDIFRKFPFFGSFSRTSDDED